MGLKEIVNSVIELADSKNIDIFGCNKRALPNRQQFVTKYSMFLSSLLDDRYKWFYDDLA